MMFSIPMLPPSPNVMRRKYRHFMAYKRLRETWENFLAYQTGSAEKTSAIRAMAKSGAKILVGVKIFHRKAYDPDNLVGSVKVCLDALCSENVRFLVNDRPEDIELKVSQVVQNGEPYTEITLEEI